MKNLRSFCLVATLASAILVSSGLFRLNGQTNDWQVVERTPQGSPISVVVSNHRGRWQCELSKVTEADLTCELERGMFHKQLVFRRDDIREVRLERPERHHMISGAIIGAAAGAAMGGVIGGRSSDPETRVYSPPLFAFLGAAVGAGIGRGIHQHGAVLYQRK